MHGPHKDTAALKQIQRWLLCLTKFHERRKTSWIKSKTIVAWGRRVNNPQSPGPPEAPNLNEPVLLYSHSLLQNFFSWNFRTKLDQVGVKVRTEDDGSTKGRTFERKAVQDRLPNDALYLIKDRCFHCPIKFHVFLLLQVESETSDCWTRVSSEKNPALTIWRLRASAAARPLADDGRTPWRCRTRERNRNNPPDLSSRIGQKRGRSRPRPFLVSSSAKHYHCTDRGVTCEIVVVVHFASPFW
jgi:hypothetical protein